MTLSLNTLRLVRQLLGTQTINVNASRPEIDSVLAARDELDAAIAEAEKNLPKPEPNRAERRRAEKAG